MPSKDVTLISEAAVNKYDVTFEFSGTVPSDATCPSAMKDITVGTTVLLPTVIPPEGYTFSGWEVADNDVTVTDHKFTMPAKDISSALPVWLIRGK